MNTTIQNGEGLGYLFRHSIRMARDHFLWLSAISIVAFEFNSWVTPELLEFTNLSTDKYGEGIGFTRQFAIDIANSLVPFLIMIPMAWVLGTGLRGESRTKESIARVLKNCWPSALVLAVSGSVVAEFVSRGVSYLQENWVYLEEFNTDRNSFVTTDFDWNKLWNTVATSAFVGLRTIGGILVLGTFGVAVALCTMDKGSSGKMFADSLRLTRNHRASIFVLFVVWVLVTMVISYGVAFLIIHVWNVEPKYLELALRPFRYFTSGLNGYLVAFTAMFLDARNQYDSRIEGVFN